MAQTGVHLDQETFTCPICLDLLKDPVTIPCGHSYCMGCIKNHWDGEDMKRTHSCPQCRQTFTPRPVLVKNTILVLLVEQLKKTGLEPADHCYAGAEDVPCDVCTERKLKAVQSCLVCLVSYCHKHIQPHHESAAFKKHTLVDPSQKLQDNVCSRHGEVMKMFCRTDHQCICYLCSVDEHKGHDTVSAAAERTERQADLEESRQTLQQRIKDKQKDVKELQQEVEAISYFAEEAVKKNNEILTELIRLLEERRRDMRRQIRSQQETEVIRVKELESKLEQEITELRRKDAQMGKLSHTHDHTQFILQYPSVSQLPEDPDSTHIHIQPRSYFKDVTTAVSELREKLQKILTEGWTNISLTITQTQVLLQPEPQILLQPQPQVLLSPQPQVQLQPQPQVLLLPQPEPQVLLPPQPQVQLQPQPQVLLPPQPEPQILLPPQPQVLLPPQPEPQVQLQPEPQVQLQPEPQVQLPPEPQVLPPPQPQVLLQPEPQVQLPPEPQILLLPQPQTRAEFIRYSREITLDPNTVNEWLSLSEENRRVTCSSLKQKYPRHPDRFSHWPQVLSRESLTGRCYWEVERSGKMVYVAVAYKDIKKKGSSNECGFGFIDKSWVLRCHNNSLYFSHDGVDSSIPGPAPSRIGVYLDHSAGLLSFYSVSKTMTRIHKVYTTFTQPLYAGVGFGGVFCSIGAAIHFPKLQ